MLKSGIRKEIKEKLNKQNNLQRLRKSQVIKDKVFSLAEFKKAKCVMFYVAKEEEVQTHAMMIEAGRLGKMILVPTILEGESKIVASRVENLEKELTPGPYGVWQPRKEYIRKRPLKEIDLILVPGLAFDKKGCRLGRGGGYYDRFLKDLPDEVVRIGLAFDFQILKELPTFSHDIPVTKVISA